MTAQHGKPTGKRRTMKTIIALSILLLSTTSFAAPVITKISDTEGAYIEEIPRKVTIDYLQREITSLEQQITKLTALKAEKVKILTDLRSAGVKTRKEVEDKKKADLEASINEVK
jgi:methionine-rich copper-binding protein CopC